MEHRKKTIFNQAIQEKTTYINGPIHITSMKQQNDHKILFHVIDKYYVCQNNFSYH